ncbi:MAG: SMP-30/gluconolactonase/LRE family protein [Acidobacteriota bacterium]|nr:SMP-30/gluconolactonase/LRE family protein [Acidobacteriota bacterium]
MQSPLKSVLGDSPDIARLVTGMKSASGPVFSRRGYLLFCDAEANAIYEWREGTRTVFRQPGNRARALTFDHQGRLIVCEKGRVARIEKDGAVTVLARTMRDPVDAIFAIDGNIYFCDRTAVYRIARGENRGTSVTVASRACREPCAVALSANQQMLYVSDTAANSIRVFGIGSTGDLENGRPFAAIVSPGALKTDEGGRVWVLGPQAIRVFGRDGVELGTVPLPEKPTGLNWGEGFHDAIVTTATAVYRVRANTSGTRTF